MGSTDNSYIFLADKTCMIDLPDAAYAEAFAVEAKKVLKGRALDYITLGTYSPKMARTLAAVLNSQPDGAPTCEIYCSNVAVQTISAQLKLGNPAFNRGLYDAWKRNGLRARLVRPKTGDHLDIGQGHDLSFFMAPTPRWPDGMFVYDPAKQKLFTSKFFGAHTVTPSGFDDDGFGVLREDWAHYFDTLIGPVATQANTVLKRAAMIPVDVSALPAGKERKRGFSLPKFFKVSTGMKRLMTAFTREQSGSNTTGEGSSGIAVATICPKHGPVIRYSVKNLLAYYEEAVAERLSTSKDINVAVIFASAYGNTGAMADAVTTGLTKAGCNVKLQDCEFCSNKDITDLIEDCQGFAVGSPTLGGHMPTPVSEAIGAILKQGNRDQPYGVFGSYGWSGEAVPAMQASLQDGGFMNKAFEPISLKFKPTPDMVELLELSGETLGKAIRKQKQSKKVTAVKDMASKQAVMTLDDKVRAIGHITTSVTALTANINGVDSMMMVPWVSQASFNPPALTLSIPKEGSPEGLFLLNSKFIVNVVGQGKQQGLVKLLNQGAREGEGCFDGFEIDRDEETGAAILKDAASWMTCTVTNRMDTGDHWLLLATLGDGKVLDASAVTYFHHRMSGEAY